MVVPVLPGDRYFLVRAPDEVPPHHNGLIERLAANQEHARVDRSGEMQFVAVCSPIMQCPALDRPFVQENISSENKDGMLKVTPYREDHSFARPESDLRTDNRAEHLRRGR